MAETSGFRRLEKEVGPALEKNLVDLGTFLGLWAASGSGTLAAALGAEPDAPRAAGGSTASSSRLKQKLEGPGRENSRRLGAEGR